MTKSQGSQVFELEDDINDSIHQGSIMVRKNNPRADEVGKIFLNEVSNTHTTLNRTHNSIVARHRDSGVDLARSVHAAFK